MPVPNGAPTASAAAAISVIASSMRPAGGQALGAHEVIGVLPAAVRQGPGSPLEQGIEP